MHEKKTERRKERKEEGRKEIKEEGRKERENNFQGKDNCQQ